MHNFAAVNLTDAKKCCLQKRPYSTKTLARDAAARQKKQGLVLYPYKCMVCGKFHLTHHEPSHKAGIKRTLRARKEAK